MFAYLKHKHNGSAVFNPIYSVIEYDDFPLNDWSNFYEDSKEVLPPNTPEPRGKDPDVITYVDVHLAGNRVTRYQGQGISYI